MAKGRKAKLDPIRDKFVKDILAAESITTIIAMSGIVKVKGPLPRLTPTQMEKIYEMAFLYTFAAWEEFLEDTFVRYLTGSRSKSYTPTFRAGASANIPHSYQLIVGTMQYQDRLTKLSWTRPNNVIDRARVFYDSGEPYRSSLTPFMEELGDARVLRNHVAHRSDSSRKDFKKVVSSYRIPANQGDSVGRFLRSKHQNKFAQLTRGTFTSNHFTAFSRMFEQLAGKIVP